MCPGNAQGSVILFEPTTSEHISSRTIDQIAVSAIAPAADCRTFAIGFVFTPSPLPPPELGMKLELTSTTILATRMALC